MNTVFHLRAKNERMAGDPEYAQDMDDLHEHRWTTEHIARMNERVVDLTKATLPPDTKIITPCNDLRMDINREVMAQYGLHQLRLNPSPAVAWRERGAIVVDMTVRNRKANSATSLGEASPTITSWVRERCDERQLDGMPGRLCFILGETYGLTGNIDIMRGMAKSMWCTAKDLIIKKDASIVWDPDTGLHHVSADDVEMAIVHLHLGDWAEKAIFDDSRITKEYEGHVPLQTLFDKSVTITLKSGRKKHLQISQVPLCLMKSFTGHKAQVQ